MAFKNSHRCKQVVETIKNLQELVFKLRHFELCTWVICCMRLSFTIFQKARKKKTSDSNRLRSNVYKKQIELNKLLDPLFSLSISLTMMIAYDECMLDGEFFNHWMGWHIINLIGERSFLRNMLWHTCNYHLFVSLPLLIFSWVSFR